LEKSPRKLPLSKRRSVSYAKVENVVKAPSSPVTKKVFISGGTEAE
jgi:hypothetical protein